MRLKPPPHLIGPTAALTPLLSVPLVFLGRARVRLAACTHALSLALPHPTQNVPSRASVSAYMASYMLRRRRKVASYGRWVRVCGWSHDRQWRTRVRMCHFRQ